MKALILSGGQGTRLRPLTLTAHKPLLPIVNLPFLNYPLALLRKHRVKDAVLCTQDETRPYHGLIEDQKKQGTSIVCSRELKALGTAGALKNAEKFIDSPDFFVFNGDILTDFDLSGMLEFHKRKSSLITVGLIRVEDPSLYGLAVASPEGRIRRFIEKPKRARRGGSLINCGIYIFDRRVFGLIPQGRKVSVEREIFPAAIAEGLPVFGFAGARKTYWLDIGSPRKYLKANLDVLNKKLSAFVPPSKVRKVGAGSAIHRSAQTENAVIGSRCEVGAGSALKNCVLLDGVVIGEGTTVENCVVGNLSHIGAFSRVSGVEALGDGTRITPYSKL